MKKILVLILSLVLIFSLSAFLYSCGDEQGPETPGPCTEHKDEDENGICDVCKQPTIDIPEAPSEVTVSFTVKDQDGATVPGVTFTFTEKGNAAATPVNATSDTSGKLSAKLVPATYKLDCEYNAEEIGYYFLDTTEIKVEATTTALDIRMENRTPNGTESRPFPLSVEDNAIGIPAGKTHYYVVYHAVNLLASIECGGIKVTYGGAEYLPDAENKIDFAFLGTDTNSVELIKIENVTDSAIDATLKIYSAPGSYSNPYVIEDLSAEISKSGLASKDIVYYSYTATASGKLTLTVTSGNTHASMTSNYVQVSTHSENSNVISIDVAAGGTVMIDLATTIEENATISFTLSFE